MDALRRSTLELWQYFKELSFNTLVYRGPAITHPSVGFYLSLNIQLVVGGSLHFWHYALDHFLSKNTGLVAKQRDWQHTNTYPISMVRFLRFLSSPSSLCRRLPSTSTATVFFSHHFHWKLLLAWFRYVAACFLRLPRLPPFGCRSGSGTAFFLYLTIFLICSAS